MTEVILVHGIWMPALVMRLLARTLAEAGFRPRLFGYRSLAACSDEHTQALAGMIRAVKTAPVCLVGHSLGGLIILRTLEQYPDLPVARVVALGSPFAGSGVARTLASHPAGRWMLGRCPETALFAGFSRWPVSAPLGVIAGRRPLGAGRLLGGLDEVSDGTVAVRETRLAGTTEHLQLHVTHTGLLLSAAVAGQVGHFLQHGRFRSAPAQC